MKKIVYFDEESALDWLDQRNDGRLEEINKEIIAKGKNFFTEAELSAEGGISSLLNMFRFKGKGKVRGDYAREGTNVVEKTITNTILTTFTDYINPEKENNFIDEIERISDYKLSLVNNSLTFFKTITPVLKMLPNKVRINDDNLKDMNIDSLDITNFDEIIDSLQGYFEFRAENETTDSEKLVRFNSNSLRNNYRLTDFLSMNLVMYGVKVGNASLEQFDIDNLFEDRSDEKDKRELSLKDFDEKTYNDKSTLNEEKLEIVDIILAGIN